MSAVDETNRFRCGLSRTVNTLVSRLSPTQSDCRPRLALLYAAASRFTPPDRSFRRRLHSKRRAPRWCVGWRVERSFSKVRFYVIVFSFRCLLDTRRTTASRWTTLQNRSLYQNHPKNVSKAVSPQNLTRKQATTSRPPTKHALEQDGGGG